MMIPTLCTTYTKELHIRAGTAAYTALLSTTGMLSTCHGGKRGSHGEGEERSESELDYHTHSISVNRPRLLPRNIGQLRSDQRSSAYTKLLGQAGDVESRVQRIGTELGLLRSASAPWRANSNDNSRRKQNSLFPQPTQHNFPPSWIVWSISCIWILFGYFEQSDLISSSLPRLHAVCD